MMPNEVEIGKPYRFAYPIEFTELPEYSKHRNEIVLVQRPCTEDEADDIIEDGQILDSMFMVLAEDGWTGCAWSSELEQF